MRDCLHLMICSLRGLAPVVRIFTTSSLVALMVAGDGRERRPRGKSATLSAGTAVFSRRCKRGILKLQPRRVSKYCATLLLAVGARVQYMHTAILMTKLHYGQTLYSPAQEVLICFSSCTSHHPQEDKIANIPTFPNLPVLGFRAEPLISADLLADP